jgi:hypothetical protein
MSERYKKEIEEVLKQAGELGTSSGRPRRQRSLWGLIWLQVAQSVGGRTWSITPGRVMLTAVALLLGALIVRSFAPGIVGLLFWAGLVLFIVGYAMFFVRPKTVEKRWRGQSIEYDGSTWWDRFRKKTK